MTFPHTWLQKVFRPRADGKSAQPSVPVGERVYAIGDIHGRCDLLEDLLTLIEADQTDYNGSTTLVFLGDYVDRGFQSKDVLERMATFPDKAQQKLAFLMGNHEQVMLDFLTGALGSEHWLRYGGLETLESYGVIIGSEDLSRESLERVRRALKTALPDHHMQFLRRLQPSFEVGSYYFCHAGVRPGTPLSAQDIDDLIWIREPFLSSKSNFGKVVVHGHSISDTPIMKANRIGVDTGAFATGRLTAVVLEAKSVRFLST